jgi:hypothetical protein
VTPERQASPEARQIGWCPGRNRTCAHGLRWWEANGGLTGNAPIARSLVIRIPIPGDLNYFPLSGHDSVSHGIIPEGVILRLRSGVDLSPYPTAGGRILQALKDYGAVVGGWDSTGAATMDLEAVYQDDPSHLWSNLNIHRNSLQGIALNFTNFAVVRKGDPKQGYDYGPTHQQWVQANMACEADPNA